MPPDQNVKRKPSKNPELDALFSLDVPSPPAEEVLQTPMQSLGQETLEFGKKAALPTIGMVGMASMASPFGVPAMLGAEALGAIGGTGASMALGIEEPDLMQVFLAGVFPSAFRAAGAVVRGVLKHIPGSSVARHELAKVEVEKVARMITPSGSSDELFAVLEHPDMNVTIPVSNLQSTVASILEGQKARPVKELTNREVYRLVTGLDEKLKLSNGTLPFKEFAAALSTFGERSQFEASTRKEVANAHRRLSAAAASDLDAAAASSIADTTPAKVLKAAHQAYNMEKTSGEVAALVSKNLHPVQGVPGADHVNTRAILMG